MRRIRWAVAALAAVTLSLTGCAAAGSDADGKPKIAVLLYSQQFEFMVALADGIKQKADELGVEVTVLDAQGDSSTQISQIQDQLAKNVDAILLSPNNSEELVPGVKMIHDADKKVVTVDSVVAGDIADAAVAFNNEAAGKMGAEHLAKLIGEEGKVLEFQGAKGAYHASLRGKGFHEGIAEFPKVAIDGRDSEWAADKALAITVDALTADPQIKGLFSHNDEMVRGIVSGLKQIGRTAPADDPDHTPVVGVDGTPLALQRIRDGSEAATVDQDPYVMGSLALQTVVDLLDDKEVEKLQLTEPKLITKDNVDDAKLWGNVFKS
ncbi:sugar ABC transporter substrate-binding protein [Saxibacter everestensis]|uniref:Sugar ABC transporter substrate-binding protein n=1 Tax=Saxibacter everestensis TaxID=2909229 RepID=A0ABY8QUZ0_9MICO|nr:sugar ABC transporter substrate-binding protein [Brevibacteriaceae bacterium ZFBP1038]